MSRTVFMHVGVAKTGTTYLQRILHSNRGLLRRNGLVYPGARRSAHFKASLDLRGATFQGHTYPDVEGAWGRLVKEVKRFDGSALISHETLAHTRKRVIEPAIASFDTDDVRIVLTTRDLARQLPAVWQEKVKNRGEQTYAEFLDSTFAAAGGRRKRGGFWRAQDIVGLSRRWANIVGADRITIVTVPPPGDPRELWRRFARAVELPDLLYDIATDSSNSSLGVAESELLRRLNPRLPDLTWPEYEGRIKRRFVEVDLAPYQVAGRLTVPKKWHDDIRQLSEQTIASLRDASYRV
nr:hypothetical protein [Propionibacteriales bacterium]